MPTYTYRCKACSHEFVELQKMSDKSLVECPECHKHTLIRLIEAGAGIVFKGSGFYITDYKKSGFSPSRKTEKHEEPSAEKREKHEGPSAEKREKHEDPSAAKREKHEEPPAVKNEKKPESDKKSEKKTDK